MKNIKIILSILIFFIISISCEDKNIVEKNVNKENYTPYIKDNIYIMLPINWKINKDFKIQNGRYIEIDKYSNYSVVQTMGLSIIDKRLNIDSIVNKNIEDIKFKFRKVNFNLNNVDKDIKLGKLIINLTNYEGDNTVDQKIYGKIGATYINDKTFIIQIINNNKVSKDKLEDIDKIIGTIKFIP